MPSKVRQAVAQVLEPGGPWRLEAEGLDRLADPALASLMSINNGYLGTRGDAGLRLSESSPRETMLAGLHESWDILHAENAYGFARTGQTMLTLPDATEVNLSVDGARMRAGVGDFLEARRSLVMSSGILRNSIVWKSPSGKRIRVEERCAVSVMEKSLMVVEVTVEALDDDCVLTVESVVRESTEEPEAAPADSKAPGLAPGMSDPRAGDSRAASFLGVVSREYQATSGSLVWRTDRSRMMAALAYQQAVNVAPNDGTEWVGEVNSEVTHSGHAIVTTFEETLARGDRFSLVKALSYHRTQVVAAGRAEADLTSDLSAAALVEQSRHVLTEHEAALAATFFESQTDMFEELWSCHDLEIQGDRLVQKALRWAVFHLLQSGVQVSDSGIAAKGLSGTGYDGHYFWDTEIYVLPFMIFTDPQSAKKVLHYRYLLLDAAKERAAEMNHKGALFPWRTIAGYEASAYYPAGTAQYHINADIAYAVDQYLTVTEDHDFLVEEGFEILLETSRLWADLGFWREVPTEAQDAGASWLGGTRSFHIFGVTGPDEYTAVVNDNFYTNVMARANLRNTLKWARWMENNRPRNFAALLDRLNLSRQELQEFQAIVGGIHIPYDERLGIHAQDDSFLQKPRWDFEGVPAEKYPLLLHFHPLVIYRHQVLKQADSVLALFLCGDEFSEEQKRADFEYYDPLTTGDSSLSAATQAVVASDVGYPELAWSYFQRALVGDLANYYGNTEHGLHMASIGGVWIAAVMGFGGLRIREGGVTIDPRLPEAWDSLRYQVNFAGRWLEVEATHASVRVRLDDAATSEATLRLSGQEFTIGPGQTIEYQIQVGEVPMPETTEGLGPSSDMPAVSASSEEADQPDQESSANKDLG